MTKQTYRQCRLQRGSSTQVSWIPAQFAIRGRVLRLRERGNDSWSDGWRVLDASGEKQLADITDAHSAIREHRKRTGDALPRQKQ